MIEYHDDVFMLCEHIFAMNDVCMFLFSMLTEKQESHCDMQWDSFMFLIVNKLTHIIRRLVIG